MHKMNKILAYLALSSLIFHCSPNQEEREEESVIKQGFHPFYVGSTWEYEYYGQATRISKEEDTSFLTEEVSAVKEIEKDGEKYVEMKIVKTGQSDTLIRFDTLKNGFDSTPREKKYEDVFPCKVYSIYPDSNKWNSNSAIEIVYEGRKFKIRVNKCSCDIRRKFSALYVFTTTTYEDSAIGVLCRKSTEDPYQVGPGSYYQSNCYLKSFNGKNINGKEIIRRVDSSIAP
jgi:hypothetical protein